MNKPISFETALEEAERSAYEYLCSITKAQAGSNAAFIGSNPGVVNAWAYNIGKEHTESAGANVTDCYSLAFNGVIEGLFSTRQMCQRFVMQIRGGLPCRDFESNVAVLEISENGMGNVEDDSVVIDGQEQPLMVWRCKIELNTVFITGGRANRVDAG